MQRVNDVSGASLVPLRGGAILSVVAKAAFDHAAGASAYAASKAAALAMMDSSAEDLRGTSVRANSILPTIIDTEANRREMTGADFDKWPRPDDFARVILFLRSDDARLFNEPLCRFTANDNHDWIRQ